ncbi:SRPBCC domain-containing protein [Xanthomarina gelatinilytica]|jgi:uncharacterized protein YndB with AHSA1/START domain|uniref:SRPBCC domain-containing protein n=1 Tax=Xanthomarina gelatinilytica TaxID=1137281 RepID=UPI003AA9CFA3
MDAKTITINTLVKSHAENVWNAYTEPKHIVNWNFASNDWQCPKVENNLKVGGTYFARMEAKDGSFGFDFKAVYDEIILHKKNCIHFRRWQKSKYAFSTNEQYHKSDYHF